MALRKTAVRKTANVNSPVPTPRSAQQAKPSETNTQLPVANRTLSPSAAEPRFDCVTARASAHGTCAEAVVRGRHHARKRRFGTRTGVTFAEQFVAEFVSWVQREGCEAEWEVDRILELATSKFAVEAGVEMPVDRNFLQALKRHPGVIVLEDHRIYDGRDNYLGKTTIYRLPVAI